MPKYKVYFRKGKPEVIEAKNLREASAKVRRLKKSPHMITRQTSNGKEYNTYYF